MLDQTLSIILVLGGCALLAALFSSCASGPSYGESGEFSESLEFMKEHTNVVVLGGSKDGHVVVAPDLSARVMTAGFSGKSSPRLGWINEKVVSGEERNPAFINFGGGERLWLSPEGGQFGLFFEPGVPFDLDNWRTPAAFNDEPYEILDQNDTRIAMARDMKIRNYQGTLFDFRVTRTVSMVNRAEAAGMLGFDPAGGLQYVGYRSENALINRGFSRMTMGKGLVSLWILSQFDANPGTWVIFPFRSGNRTGGEEEGPTVNDDYFGKVPAERLNVSEELGCALFQADGRRRSKIGLSLAHTRDVIGSIDFSRNILTVVTFNLPRQGYYAANTWEIQKAPFSGDVVNSYNNGLEGEDGPVPECFYELETLSPVKELAPGHRIDHVNTTMHFCGSIDDLNAISMKLLKVDLWKVRAAAGGMSVGLNEVAKEPAPAPTGGAEADAPVRIGADPEKKKPRGRRPRE